MNTLYGFKSSNASEEPAWFRSPESALRFAAACGWSFMREDLLDVADSDDVDPESIMEEPGVPWAHE